MNNTIIQIDTTELMFDRQNPRLYEYGVTADSQDEEILEILWDTMDVRELVQSIQASGFFSHEALFVSKEKGEYIVIEGNRRLAAVKVLLSDSFSIKYGVEKLSEQERTSLRLHNLPCKVISREDAWRFLGFKHVNGPAKWSGFAKATYIAKVHNEYKVPLDQVARQIGDRHNTVQRLYRGLMLLVQAERKKVFDVEDRYNQRLYFSHLYTCMNYEGYSSFLGLRDEGENEQEPVAQEKLKELGELCVWLFGSKKLDRKPVVVSQNPDLRKLGEVLANSEALAALRANESLDTAYEISRSPTAILEESILTAKRNLQKARAFLTLGFNGQADLLRHANDTANLASDLASEMEMKIGNPKKRSSREE